MKRIWNNRKSLCLFFAVLFCFAPSVHGADGDKEGADSPPEQPPRLTLKKAVLCEGLKELAPVNETILFSVALGGITCFTAFDPVPKKTVVFHTWFKRDQSKKKIKLTIKPPKWSSFSKIRIRNMDVGPWRVDIADSEGKIFKTLRFSVTE